MQMLNFLSLSLYSTICFQMSFVVVSYRECKTQGTCHYSVVCHILFFNKSSLKM